MLPSSNNWTILWQVSVYLNVKIVATILASTKIPSPTSKGKMLSPPHFV
jgi:hypothetical protein